jgi:CheY-like chemotaxis protein
VTEAPRVLIVEHDDPIRRTLALAVESLGCTAVAVGSGSDAVDAVGAQVFAVALVESRLPGALSGSETLEALKLQLPSLPVVLLGEPERPADVLAAFHAGAADVLLKPFEVADLRAALARAFAQPSDRDRAALDFHARLELAKTALVSAAFDVAGAHLRAALAQDPLDAEALDLYGVVRELAGDAAAATRAYRAAFACDPRNARARANVERASDQFTYLGLLDDARMDLFRAAAARIAVPLIDPVRDLPLCRLATLLGGSSIGVAVGVLLDPPTEEATAKTIARRRGFVRPTGRGQPSVPCVIDYVFAADRAAGARKLRDDEDCALVLVGEWLPEVVRAALAGDGAADTADTADTADGGVANGAARTIVARVAELDRYDVVRPDVDSALALALGVNLARAANAQLALPRAWVETLPATALPVHALFAHAQLARPGWVHSEGYVSVRADDQTTPAITVGAAAEATIRLV